MHSAFNLPPPSNSMFMPFFYIFFIKGYVLSGEITLKNNHYYYDNIDVMLELGFQDGLFLILTD